MTTLHLTPEQWALIHQPATRQQVLALVPAAVMLADSFATDDEDNPTIYWTAHAALTEDDVDLVLYLLDNPAVLDAIAAEMPAQEE